MSSATVLRGEESEEFWSKIHISDFISTFKQQTKLSDGAIHRKYIEFKKNYPLGFVRKEQLTSLLVERYLSVLKISSDSEKEEVRQMLYKDESLKNTVNKIVDITTNSQGGTWAFLGFREVKLRDKVHQFSPVHLFRSSWS